MSTLYQFTQTPLEKRMRTIDYSNWLDVGETLSDHAIAVSPSSDPPLVASDAFSSSANTQITFFISGGVVGTVYQVKCLATTSQGQVKEDNIQIAVYAQ
jgi:hypothetical protein